MLTGLMLVTLTFLASLARYLWIAVIRTPAASTVLAVWRRRHQKDGQVMPSPGFVRAGFAVLTTSMAAPGATLALHHAAIFVGLVATRLELVYV